MANQLQYVVKYPKHSCHIGVAPKGIHRPYNPKEIYAETWPEAHAFLQYHAEQRLAAAEAELAQAQAHLAAVNALQDPTGAAAQTIN